MLVKCTEVQVKATGKAIKYFNSEITHQFCVCIKTPSWKDGVVCSVLTGKASGPSLAKRKRPFSQPEETSHHIISDPQTPQLEN